jgi:hypothetical protein
MRKSLDKVALEILPMEIQIGDRFTDREFEWESAGSADAMNRCRLPLLLPWVNVNLLIRSITGQVWRDEQWRILKH